MLQRVQGRKEAKGTGKLEKHSGLTTLLPQGCLRVLGKAVQTKRVRGRVSRDTRYCSSWSRAEKGCQGMDGLPKQLSYKILLILKITGKAGTKVSQGQQFGMRCGSQFVLREVQICLYF